MIWQHDWAFRGFAELLWPEEYGLARAVCRHKGQADAARVMAERHRGFRASVELAKTAKDVAALQAEMARSVS